MATTRAESDVVEIPLVVASADAYCQSILATPKAEMWWFQTGLAPYRGFSRPFSDRDGRWWWRPKPQFAWLLDYYTALERRVAIPFGRSLLGYQYPVAEERANSLVHFNVIRDLTGYDISRLASQKRRAIRKGLRGLELTRIEPRDREVAEQARVIWNSHVERIVGRTRVYRVYTTARCC